MIGAPVIGTAPDGSGAGPELAPIATRLQAGSVQSASAATTTFSQPPKLGDVTIDRRIEGVSMRASGVRSLGFGDLDEAHAQVEQRLAEQSLLVPAQIAARLFLQQPEQIDRLSRQR